MLSCRQRSSTSFILAKKYDEAGDRWEVRVNKDWRFYFAV